jgi:hypothetical protein
LYRTFNATNPQFVYEVGEIENEVNNNQPFDEKDFDAQNFKDNEYGAWSGDLDEDVARDHLPTASGFSTWDTQLPVDSSQHF